jgi:hypothetical protein
MSIKMNRMILFILFLVYLKVIVSPIITMLYPEKRTFAHIKFVNFPDDFLLDIAENLDIVSLIKLSMISKRFYKCFENIIRKKKNEIPWQITTEYHFNMFRYEIHQSWIHVGWFYTKNNLSEICDFCSNLKWKSNFVDGTIAKCVTGYNSICNELVNCDIKTIVLKGKGGPILNTLLESNGDIDITYNIDWYLSLIYPTTINTFSLVQNDSRLIVTPKVTQTMSIVIGYLYKQNKNQKYIFNEHRKSRKKINIYNSSEYKTYHYGDIDTEHLIRNSRKKTYNLNMNSLNYVDSEHFLLDDEYDVEDLNSDTSNITDDNNYDSEYNSRYDGSDKDNSDEDNSENNSETSEYMNNYLDIDDTIEHVSCSKRFFEHDTCSIDNLDYIPKRVRFI